MVHLYPHDIVTIPFCFHDYYSAYFPPPPPRVYSNFLILVIVASSHPELFLDTWPPRQRLYFQLPFAQNCLRYNLTCKLTGQPGLMLGGKKKKKKESPGSKDIITRTNSRVQNCLFFFFQGCHNKGSQTRQLKQQRFIFLQLTWLGIQDQFVSKTGFF